jgi:pullulanase/glycogen debranching enzyme
MSVSNHHVHVLPEQLPHAPQRAAGVVHLIAPEVETIELHDDDTDADTDSKFIYEAARTLQNAGRLVATMASSVIHREAASVNQRLLHVQDRWHRQKRRRLTTAGDAEDSSSSIAISGATKPEESDRTTVPSLKQDTKTETSTSTTSAASTSIVVSEQESLSIWNQAARTKRMSILLRDLEMTHSLLLREIAAASMARDAAGNDSSTNIADGPPSN